MSTPSTRSIWRIVAEREVATRLANRAFRISFAITAVAILAGTVAMGILMDKAPTYHVAVDSAKGKTIAQAGKTSLDPDAKLKVTVYQDRKAAEAAVEDGKQSVGLVETGDRAKPWAVIGNDDIDPALGGALSTAVSNAVVQANAEREDVDLSRLTAGSQVDQILLDKDAEQTGARKGIAFAMGLLFYVFALIFGMQIATSVVQEKESRVVEILAAATDTRDLLWGKIAGNTVLAMGQIVAMVGLAFVGFAVTGRGDFLSGVGPSLVWFVVFFLIGFVALASLWSAAGAMVSRLADINATTVPMQMLLLVGYLLASFGSGTALVAGSQVPIVSAMVMPARIAQESVPLWQVLVALLINIAAALVLVRVGARIYDRGLLQTDRKLSFREALTRA